MCVLSIKVPIGKKYGKLFNDPRIYISADSRVGFFGLIYFEALRINPSHLLPLRFWINSTSWHELLWIIIVIQQSFCTVGWGCRIHRLASLQRGKTPPQWVSWLDTKQSDGEVPVMLEFWGMRSIRSLPSLPGTLWPGVVAPDRVLSMCQIEINCVLMLKWIAWTRTVLKQPQIPHLNRGQVIFP